MAVVVKKLLAIVLGVGLLNGCASLVPPSGLDATGCMEFMQCVESPQVVRMPTYKELLSLPPAEAMPVVAVYKFPDLTGQRKQSGGTALFSTAVTQGGATMLIDALKTAGNGKWFRVVERVGIDNLTRERQIVRTTREQYSDDDEQKLGHLYESMLFFQEDSLPETIDAVYRLNINKYGGNDSLQLILEHWVSV